MHLLDQSGGDLGHVWPWHQGCCVGGGGPQPIWYTLMLKIIQGVSLQGTQVERVDGMDR